MSYWPSLFFLKLAIQPCRTRVQEYGQQKVSVLLINVSYVMCVKVSSKFNILDHKVDTYIIDSDKLLNDITFACTVIRVSISWTLKPRLIIHCPVIILMIYMFVMQVSESKGSHFHKSLQNQFQNLLLDVVLNA